MGLFILKARDSVTAYCSELWFVRHMQGQLPTVGIMDPPESKGKALGCF